MPSFRADKEPLVQQIADLLHHCRTQQELIERAIALLHRETFPEKYPAPERAIIAWVKGRTSKGEEGYLPVVEGGKILDYIDDIDE